MYRKLRMFQGVSVSGEPPPAADFFFPSKTAIFFRLNTPIFCQSALNYPDEYALSSADRGISLFGLCIAISLLRRTSLVIFRQTFPFESKTIRPPTPCTDVATTSPDTVRQVRNDWRVTVLRDTLLALGYAQNIATEAY